MLTSWFLIRIFCDNFMKIIQHFPLHFLKGREREGASWCRGAKIGLFAKKCVWVSNPVHGALGVTSVPPGQLGQLYDLCFQTLVLV